MLLVARAALRSLPILRLVRPGVIGGIERHSTFAKLALPAFRCGAISLLAAFVPAEEWGAFAAAADAAKSAAVAAKSSADAAKFAADEFSAFDANRAASGDVGHAAAVEAFDAVSEAASASLSSAAVLSAVYSAAAAHSFAALSVAVKSPAPYISAFATDLNTLGTKGTVAMRRTIATSPLWPEGGAEEISASWRDFIYFLRMTEFRSEIWPDWYDAIVAGEKSGNFLFGLPTAIAPHLLQQIAFIDNAIWAAGHSDVDEEIRRIVAEERQKEDAAENKPDGASSAAMDGADPAPEIKSSPLDPKTAIGRAVIENAVVLVAQAYLLRSLIEAELKRLRENPANHPDTQAEQDQRIAALKVWLTSLVNTESAIAAYRENKKPENAVVKAVKELAATFQGWWKVRGSTVSDMGLVLGGTSLIALTKADPTACLLISAAIVAPRPVSEVLSAWKGNGKKAKKPK